MGSNPIRVVCIWINSRIHSEASYGILAQLGEHLPYKQRVIGSSPIGPTNQFYIDYAGVAELADAQDLKSCGTNLPYRFDSGRRHYYLEDPFFQLDIEVGSFFDKENVHVW